MRKPRHQAAPTDEVRPDLPLDPHHLTDAQLVHLCFEHGIRGDLPYSQLEAEAVHRGVDLRTVVRERLIQRLKEAGVL